MKLETRFARPKATHGQAKRRTLVRMVTTKLLSGSTPGQQICPKPGRLSTRSSACPSLRRAPILVIKRADLGLLDDLAKPVAINVIE